MSDFFKIDGIIIKSPIKVIPSDLYYLIIEDADEVRHYWHKKHTSIIEDKEVNFEDGQYDGNSFSCGQAFEK